MNKTHVFRAKLLPVLLVAGAVALLYVAAEGWNRYLVLTERVSVLEEKMGIESPSTPGPQLEATPMGQIGAIRANDHLIGNRNAEIFLIEYSDFDCPYCRKFHPVVRTLLEGYDGRVALVYRHYPLAIHPNAWMKAEASECLVQQTGEVAYSHIIDALFTQTHITTPEQAASLASQFQVNPDQLLSCITANETKDRVQQDARDGEKIDIKGTPATLVVRRDGSGVTVFGAQSVKAMQEIINGLLD